MASSSALLRRVATIERKLTPPHVPRQWSIILEEGESLAPDLVSQLGKWDEVIIRFMPAHYLGECQRSQVMSCWLDAGGGKKKAHSIRSYGVDIGSV